MVLIMPSSLYCVIPLKYALAPDFRVAFAAVHRSPVSWLERYLGIYAARGTDSRIHLPLPLIAVTIIAAIRTTALLFIGLSTLRTTLRIIGVTLGCEELLLGGAESETYATLHAL